MQGRFTPHLDQSLPEFQLTPPAIRTNVSLLQPDNLTSQARRDSPAVPLCRGLASARDVLTTLFLVVVNQKEIEMNRTLVNCCLAIAILVLPLQVSGLRLFAQRNDKEPSVKELLKLPGKVVSEAKSDRPSGDLKLTGYRVEELQLPRTVTIEMKGQQVAVDKAWRVTVTGGPFPVRAMPAVIWVDDQIVGIGIENETLSQITAVTFDGSLIREGGVVALSYGEEKDARVRLSQRLQLREGGQQ